MFNLVLTLLATLATLGAQPVAAQFSASGDPRPSGAPTIVAQPPGPNCKRLLADYLGPETLEPKAYAQSPDGKSCGANHGTKDNRDSAKPVTGFKWDAIKARAVQNCGGIAKGCVVVMTNSQAWTTFLPYDEWVQKTREARPQIKDDTTVLDRNPHYDGDYEGKLVTIDPKNGKAWNGVFKGRSIQGVLEGTVSGPGLPDGRLKANILADGKVGAGTFFGGRTNYAVNGQIADKVPGDPVKGQVLRATITPLEQGQFPSGNLEAERKG